MVKAPYYDSNGIKKGAWDKEEDDRLQTFIHRYGYRNWRLVPIYAGLKRCGKSCRLRWENYLKPGLKRGGFSTQEHELIIKLYSQIGSKWSTMASYFPGRTDNDLKNYWNGHINKPSKRNRKVSKAIDKNIQLRNNNNEHYSSLSMNDPSNSKFPHNLTEPAPKNSISSGESFGAHQESLSTELPPPQNCDDGHINYHWDHYREISSVAFNFGIYKEIESDKLSSFVDPISVIPGINCPGTSSDSSPCSNDGIEGNFWWDSFGNETNSINETKIDGLPEEDYALLSYLLW